MENVYFYCAAIGGGILVLQTLLMVIGGTDADVDADIAPDFDAGDLDAADGVLLALSLKTVVAFLTFFGLGGLICIQKELSGGATLAIATGSGCIAFIIVAQLMRWMTTLQSSGNVDLGNAIGSSATVYLRIPGNNSGAGKVTVAVQGRTITQKAVTKGDEIPTGAQVRLDRLAGPDTFEVSAQQ